MTRRRWSALAVVLLLCAAAGAVALQRRATDVDRSTAMVPGAGTVELEAKLYVPDDADAQHPVPAVLVAHGLGDDQSDVADIARTLARAGYVVRTWNSRGVGESTGRVGVADPRGEVADLRALVDELATRPEVRRDGDGDPRVGVVGVSHGGGTGILAAARDDRIDALVPVFAWYDLRTALQPDAAGGAGVLKVRWGSELFAAGAGKRRTPTPCGNVDEDACAAWAASVEAGSLTDAARDELAERSLAGSDETLDVPTLVVQGQMDSLFDLRQGLGIAQAVRRAKAPVRVEWLRGGHDLPLDERRRHHLEDALLRWFDRHLRAEPGVQVGPRFTVQLGAGRGYANAPEFPPEYRELDLSLAAEDDEDDAGFVRYAAPAGGLPSETTTLPGLGDVTGTTQGLGVPTGQHARFVTEPVDRGVEIVGSLRVRLRFAGDRPGGIAFVRAVDIAPGGRRLVLRGLVAPVRLDRLPTLASGDARDVEVALPPVAWRLAPAHRLGIEVASTDAGFVAPPAPATFAVALAGTGQLAVPEVTTPRRSSDAVDAGRDPRVLFGLAGVLVALALSAAAVATRLRARSSERVQEPSLRDVPLQASGLVKRYGGGRVAVAGVSFRVDPGTVVGLVGPNGAGKTTIMRMLLGLVHPSDGTAHLFGQRIRPGVPHLARVGALVEGPGLLPHLTGREHLERYWGATGRPAPEAGIGAALRDVGLEADADRRVGTWSHGMRQRLGIAQALLGRPDLVLLDEPTNGLDPAQVAQLRALVRDIALGGRSVLVSSHQLDELERTCTHVVLVREGQVLAAGTLGEVRGTHPDLEAAFLAHVEQGGGDGA